MARGSRLRAAGPPACRPCVATEPTSALREPKAPTDAPPATADEPPPPVDPMPDKPPARCGDAKPLCAFSVQPAASAFLPASLSCWARLAEEDAAVASPRGLPAAAAAPASGGG